MFFFVGLSKDVVTTIDGITRTVGSYADRATTTTRFGNSYERIRGGHSIASFVRLHVQIVDGRGAGGSGYVHDVSAFVFLDDASFIKH